MYSYVNNNSSNYDYLGAKINRIKHDRNELFSNNLNSLAYTKYIGAKNYDSFAENAIIKAYKDGVCYVGQVVEVAEPVIEIATYWPKAKVMETKNYYYTKDAMEQILGHEKRRFEVYQKANSEYLEKVVVYAKSINDIALTESEAIENTRKKLNEYWLEVSKQFINYIRYEQRQISIEYHPSHYIYAKNEKKGSKRKIIGFDFTHKINDPEPIIQPSDIVFHCR